MHVTTNYRECAHAALKGIQLLSEMSQLLHWCLAKENIKYQSWKSGQRGAHEANPFFCMRYQLFKCFHGTVISGFLSKEELGYQYVIKHCVIAINLNIEVPE